MRFDKLSLSKNRPDWSKIRRRILTRLNIGLLIIVVSIYIADAFVNSQIFSCYYSVTPPIWCFKDNAIGYVGHVFILSASVTTGAILVVQYMLSARRLRLLLLAGFAFLIFYPVYTIHRVNTDLDFCQQRLSSFVDSCRAHANEMHYSHYIISLHTIILGIIFLTAFFYLSYNRRKTQNNGQATNAIASDAV